jgi:hypothetical protein
MSVISILAKDDAPAIELDSINKIIKIEGPSFPEDALEIYQPILKWLSENENILDELKCSFDYTILSSASNKVVFELFLKLEKMYNNGKNISVKWFYSSFDEDMLDEGRGFKENMKIPFELIEKQH